MSDASTSFDSFKDDDGTDPEKSLRSAVRTQWSRLQYYETFPSDSAERLSHEIAILSYIVGDGVLAMLAELKKVNEKR